MTSTRRNSPTNGGRPGTAGATRRASETRRRLLDATAAEMIRCGGHPEMADIAVRAGLSVGLSYHYFGSKAGLLAAVVEDFYDRYDATIIDVNPLSGSGWPARERRRLELMVDFCLSDPLAPIVLARLSAEPEVATVEARRLARHIALGAKNIALGQAQGHLPTGPNPRLLVGMIMGGLRHALGQALVESGILPRDRLVDELWRFVAAAAGLQPRIQTSRRTEGPADHAKSAI